MQEGETFVVLLRHGIAEERGSRDDDDARVLTKKGSARMEGIARALRRLFPKADALFTSPLVRCVETAERVADAYRKKLNIETTPLLRPDGKPAGLQDLVDGAAGSRIICVGHEPALSKMMCGVTKTRGSFELKKGGCYGVRFFGDGTARLEWMLPPRVLRR